MTQPLPPHDSQRPTVPQGFGPAPQPFGPPPTGDSGPPPGGSRTGGRRKGLVIALAVLLVAGAGTGGWLLWGKDGKKAAPEAKPTRSVDAKLDWMVPMPSPDKDHAQRVAPLWFAKGNVVMNTKKTVTAYSVATGKPSWTVPVPGFACTQSPKPDGGVAVIVYGKAEFECDKLMAVDLERGRQLWTKDMVNAQGNKDMRSNANIALSNGLVNVAEVGEALVYDAKSGAKRKAKNYGCMERGTAVKGDRQLTVAQCQIFGRQFVMNVDPKTGVEKWTWKVMDGIEVHNVLSADPPVLAVGRENDNSPSDIVTLDDKGRLKALISISAGPYHFEECRKGVLESCDRTVTDDRTVYLSTRSDETNEDGVSVTAIVAVDLATGKKRWTAPLGGNRANRPLAMHDGRLLVYQMATKDEGGKLLSLDPADGTPTVYMKLPEESAEREYSLARRGTAYFRDDHFYLVPEEGMSDPSMIMSFH
ncbi:PQQ-binding-like beta-propeller repeat protein [Streptomyces syringium]|uniref:outer membrane protein assembly factor BamB family protein n=1 Tax=Streptomyces syringium TaxID=76729 RepID=UPI0037D90F04